MRLFLPVWPLALVLAAEPLSRSWRLLPVAVCVAGLLWVGTRLHSITRHFVGAFHAVPGARAFRRHLAEHGTRRGAGVDVLREAIALVDGGAVASIAA